MQSNGGWHTLWLKRKWNSIVNEHDQQQQDCLSLRVSWFNNKQLNSMFTKQWLESHRQWSRQAPLFLTTKQLTMSNKFTLQNTTAMSTTELSTKRFLCVWDRCLIWHIKQYLFNNNSNNSITTLHNTTTLSLKKGAIQISRHIHAHISWQKERRTSSSSFRDCLATRAEGTPLARFEAAIVYKICS